jgi:hypothetical protein
MFEVQRKLKSRDLAKHPLAPTLVGFTLTGIIGAGISYWWQSYQNGREYTLNIQQIALERGRLAVERRRKNIMDITELLYERRTWASLVVSSLRRSAAGIDELEERKNVYDHVYVRWNSNLQNNLFTLREMPGAEYYFEI